MHKFDVEQYVSDTLDWAEEKMREHVLNGDKKSAIAIGQEFVSWANITPGEKVQILWVASTKG